MAIFFVLWKDYSNRSICGGFFLPVFSDGICFLLSSPNTSLLMLPNSNQFTAPRLSEKAERLRLYLYLR